MAKNKKGEDVRVERVVGWEEALSHKGNNTIYVIDEADFFFVDSVKDLPN